MADFSISQSNLKTYSFYKKLSPLKASAIMLELDPIYFDRVSFQDKHGGEIRLLADILEQLAFEGEFIDIVKGEEVYINGISEYVESISTAELKNWALSNGYQWLGQTEISALDKLELNIKSFVEYNEQIQRELQERVDYIAELEQQLEELKQKLAQATQPSTVEEKQNRISQPQRDIFTLLVMNNYQNYQSRNALFEAINADMKAKGIRASDIKYPTLDNLIDDNLRINKISPFPPKQK
ncbi:hypothetical protein [Glaesserella parasuis]|uniref:hypothetical protein n=1 Tax=Glaesserella parasuis TaxID=738 RepID=UPI00094FD2D1|nr:hypothetical protein [Glaesserella parasuis]MWQ49556.1 hypothetical protein [Glaesserella parasuis]